MFDDTERIYETEHIHVKYLTNDVLLLLPEEGERHEEGNSEIMEYIGSGISEEIRKQQFVTWKE